MIAYENNSDEQLFALISINDETAFRTFFYRYHTKVFYFILHLVKRDAEAEELTQDVFLKIWESRKLLDEVENAGNYLFVIAKNRCLDHLKRRAAEKSTAQHLEALLPNQSDSANEEILYRQSRELVAMAVDRLPDQQRRIYHLSKEQGFSRQEIAMQLSISPHTVKNHLRVAIRSVQQYLRQAMKS